MNPISRRTFLARTAGTAVASLLAGRTSALPYAETLQSRLARDPLRPQYHLLPAANWMNDPNGPIFYRGRYHMFFQYNPNGAFWGSMHWAHATSPDMVHWQHEPVAIAPTPGGYDRYGVFSGSAVLEGTIPTVIYTGVLPPGSPAAITLDDGRHQWREVQCLATSSDPELGNWKKLPEPIIARPPEGMAVTGFRDPGVWQEGQEWLLTLGSGIKGRGGNVLLYRSPNLRDWTYLHPLIQGEGNGRSSTNSVDNGDMWECPDFFPLGDRYVLLVSTMGKVRWKIGTYRERRFTPEKEGIVDFGSYYAAKTQLDREGRRVLWGWIPETRPETEYRAAGWAGLMSLPRTLSLGTDGGLEMSVAPAVNALRTNRSRVPAGSTGAQKQKLMSAVRIRNLSAELHLETESGTKFRLRLVGERGEPFADVAYDPAQKNTELRVNRISAALPGSGLVSIRLFLDGSALEVFANRKAAVTARIYTETADALRLEVENLDALRSVDVWQMRPISKDRLTT
jgi:beta-fructofuranosidase